MSTWFRNASRPAQPDPSRACHRSSTGASPPTARCRPTPITHATCSRCSAAKSVHSYESVTSLCPGPVCETAPLPLTQALEDASIVYGHRSSRCAARRVAADRQLVGCVRRGRTAVAAVTTSATPTRAGSGSAPTSAARSARRQSSASARRRSPPDTAALRPRRRAAPSVGAVTERVRSPFAPGADTRSRATPPTRSRTAWSSSCTACRSAPPTR